MYLFCVYIIIFCIIFFYCILIFFISYNFIVFNIIRLLDGHLPPRQPFLDIATNLLKGEIVNALQRENEAFTNKAKAQIH